MKRKLYPFFTIARRFKLCVLKYIFSIIIIEPCSFREPIVSLRYFYKGKMDKIILENLHKIFQIYVTGFPSLLPAEDCGINRHSYDTLVVVLFSVGSEYYNVHIPAQEKLDRIIRFPGLLSSLHSRVYLTL